MLNYMVVMIISERATYTCKLGSYLGLEVEGEPLILTT
jgi:hypothetical protein